MNMLKSVSSGRVGLLQCHTPHHWAGNISGATSFRSPLQSGMRARLFCRCVSMPIELIIDVRFWCSLWRRLGCIAIQNSPSLVERFELFLIAARPVQDLVLHRTQNIASE